MHSLHQYMEYSEKTRAAIKPHPSLYGVRTQDTWSLAASALFHLLCFCVIFPATVQETAIWASKGRVSVCKSIISPGICRKTKGSQTPKYNMQCINNDDYTACCGSEIARPFGPFFDSYNLVVIFCIDFGYFVQYTTKNPRKRPFSVDFLVRVSI